MLRQCVRCKENKPLDQFALDNRISTGLAVYCRACDSSRFRQKYKTQREVEVWRVGRYQHSEKGKAMLRKRGNVRYQKYPEKINASQAARYAIKTGKLIPKPCEVCGDEKVQGHHYKGYDKQNWLEVQWLCVAHHLEVHGKAVL